MPREARHIVLFPYSKQARPASSLAQGLLTLPSLSYMIDGSLRKVGFFQ